MITTRIANIKDIPGVLSLQEKYLFKNLTELEREDGFVTVPFTLVQLEQIINLEGLFIALDNTGVIVAYVFAGSWEYFQQWEIFTYMVSRFPVLSFDKREIRVDNSFQYGPICIDKKHRGRGLIHQIFEEMRVVFVKQYPIAITFINKVNEVSIRAHTQKLDWKIIDEFQFNGNTYLGLAFDMSKSQKLKKG